MWGFHSNPSSEGAERASLEIEGAERASLEIENLTLRRSVPSRCLGRRIKSDE